MVEVDRSSFVQGGPDYVGEQLLVFRRPERRP